MESNDGIITNSSAQPLRPVMSSQANAASGAEQASNQTQKISRKELDKKPWKYVGYRGYTEFLASENDFLIFRRFSTVSTRIALMLQHQVSVLEAKLDLLDVRYSKRDAVDVNNGSFRDDEDDRLQVFEELRVKLLEYSKYYTSNI